MDIRHTLARAGQTTGQVQCRECARTWQTTPEQDQLLTELDEHQRQHDDEPPPAA